MPRAPVPVAVAITASTMALGIFLAAPAVADDSADTFLELSRDGVHYAPGMVHDSFETSNGYVPGESRPATIWVRNASKESAQLSLAVDNMDQRSGAILPEYLELGAAAGNRNARARALPGYSRCNSVFENWTLPGGQALKMNLDLNLSANAPNATRNQSSSFDLVFLLQATNEGQSVSPCASDATLPAAGVSAGRAPVKVGPAPNPATAKDNGITWIMDDAGTDVAAVRPPQAAPGYSEPLATLPQSNVEAINLWPWLLALGAAAYMVITFRSRSRSS